MGLVFNAGPVFVISKSYKTYKPTFSLFGYFVLHLKRSPEFAILKPTLEEVVAMDKTDNNKSRPDIFPKKTLRDIIPSSKERADNDLKNFEIPKFDLAKDILSEHRKQTSNKRIRSTAKPQPQLQTPPVPIKEIIEHRELEPSEHSQVITEIVARDIARLCRKN